MRLTKTSTPGATGTGWDLLSDSPVQDFPKRIDVTASGPAIENKYAFFCDSSTRVSISSITCSAFLQEFKVPQES